MKKVLHSTRPVPRELAGAGVAVVLSGQLLQVTLGPAPSLTALLPALSHLPQVNFLSAKVNRVVLCCFPRVGCLTWMMVCAGRPKDLNFREVCRG